MDKKGFTLIELLVVIAIIGILASVVLAQFPGAVSKTRDGRVISSMGQFRMQARILYVNYESYSDVACDGTTDESIQALCNDIEDNSDESFFVRVTGDKKGFCAVAHLPSAGKYFCVDSDLRAKAYVISPAATGGVCDEVCITANSCRCE